MTAQEINRLKEQGLSHIARTLYILYLRDLAVKENIITLDYGFLNYNLNSYSSFFPCELSYNDIDNLVRELLHFQLIEIVQLSSNQTFNGSSIKLPFLMEELTQLPSKPFLMHVNWQPGPSFYHSAKFSGLLDTNFSPSDLQGFINYWINKNEMRNQAAWERAFVQRLLRQRENKIQIDGSLYKRY